MVVDLIGGNQHVAYLCGVTHKAVSNWRANGRFPPSTYLVLRGALAEIGLTAPNELWSMRERPPRRKARR